MYDLRKIYQETKFLDTLFDKENDIRSEEIIKKNILELLVELGELAQETRCFKYWSTKGPNKKEIILEEYIDCLNMILYFCNIKDVSLEEEMPVAYQNNMIEVFIRLYQKIAELNQELTKEKVKQILVDLLYLGELLEFSQKDLEDGTKEKSKIIQNRFQENY